MLTTIDEPLMLAWSLLCELLFYLSLTHIVVLSSLHLKISDACTNVQVLNTVQWFSLVQGTMKNAWLYTHSVIQNIENHVPMYVKWLKCVVITKAASSMYTCAWRSRSSSTNIKCRNMRNINLFELLF